MKRVTILMLCLIGFFLLTSESKCVNTTNATSTSGIKKATVKVETDLNGNTIEQNNIINRLKEDNKPGSIKHLYIISAYSGQTIIYSTVKGKVTSSGKRLSPSSVSSSTNTNTYDGFLVEFGDKSFLTKEVLDDGGAYGSSVEYIYWWDSKGIYHQQYITGGMIVHISNEPLSVKNITLNFELNN
jgi:hypothetical protein